MQCDTKPEWAILNRLASVLGVPVERFFTEALHLEDAASHDECLRLWSRIKTDKGRRQALEALQAIAEAEPTK